MSTDDLVALSWISAGALASSCLTVAILVSIPAAPEVPRDSPSAHAPRLDATTPSRPVIDFAIIREVPVTVAGPETPPSGLDLRARHDPPHRR